MEEEEWRPIQDYPGYSVSNLGRVKSFKRGSERILKTFTRENGRVCVPLNRNAIKSTIPIYRLMAIAFIPNPENKPYVDHINRDVTDNRLINLRWVTAGENVINRDKHSTNKVGLKGVTFRWNSYHATIKMNGKYVELGSFDTPEEAHAVYLAKARELHGDYFYQGNNGSRQEGGPEGSYTEVGEGVVLQEQGAGEGEEVMAVS